MRTRDRAVSLPTRVVTVFVVLEVVAIVTLALVGALRHQASRSSHEINLLVVRELQLNDLALSSGTSYTRHPSQAEFFAAHNEHPSAIEHMPAGSVLQPPPGIGGTAWAETRGEAP